MRILNQYMSRGNAVGNNVASNNKSNSTNSIKMNSLTKDVVSFTSKRPPIFVKLGPNYKAADALPELSDLVKNKARVIIGGYFEDAVSMDNKAQKIEGLLERAIGEKVNVHKSEDVVGSHTQELIQKISDEYGVILVNLENEKGFKFLSKKPEGIHW